MARRNASSIIVLSGLWIPTGSSRLVNRASRELGCRPEGLNQDVWYRSRRRCLMPALCRLRFCRATSSYLPKMVFISAVSAIARAPDEGWLDDFEKIAAAAGSRSRPFKTDLSRSSIFLLSGYPYTSCNCLAISAAVSRS